MNILRSLFVLIAAAVATTSLPAQATSAHPSTSGRKSPHETVSTVIGDRRTGNRVTITYGRPYRKSPTTGEIRKIWGGLVPWDKPDRLGADEATLLITQKPLVFREGTVPAGAYTLYTIPSETGPFKLAFSTNLGKWGIPVDTKHDLLRVEMKKSAIEKPVEQLTLAVGTDAASGGGVLKISWENTEYSVPFTVAK